MPTGFTSKTEKENESQRIAKTAIFSFAILISATFNWYKGPQHLMVIKLETKLSRLVLIIVRVSEYDRLFLSAPVDTSQSHRWNGSANIECF